MRHYLVLFLCFVCVAGNSQSMAEKALVEARNLNSLHKENEALAKFKLALAFDMNNYEAFWNCSLLSSRLGRREADKVKQRELYIAAKTYAEKALKANANDVQSNYVMAVAMGRIAQISETKEKIAAVRDIKRFAERAVELAPGHAASNHVLAVWHLEVSELNWMERQVADKFFGGLPDASKDKAIDYCKKASTLEPNYILYHFELGRIYKAKGDKVNAKLEYTKAGSLKAVTPDDPDYQQQAKKILETL